MDRVKKVVKLLTQIEKLRGDLNIVWKEMSEEEHAAYYDNAPKRSQVVPRRPGAGVHGDVLTNDGSMMTVDESEDQRLWIRVGMVFHGNKVQRQPGIWISYQEKALESKLQGPVLISPSIWRRVNRAVEQHLEGWGKPRSDRRG